MRFWPTWRQRNRRLGERENLLDVKVRVSQSRAERMRAVGAGVGGLLAAAAVIGGVWLGGQWLLNRMVYRNEAFALQRIEIQTDGALRTDVIRQWAGVRAGQNLMALDLMRVKRDLESQPAIQFAAVERALPHTLRLTVTERDPVAQAVVTQTAANGRIEEALYDFDAEGYPMRPLDPRWRAVPPSPNDALPLLVGVPPNSVAAGEQVESPQIRAALRLISEFDHSPMAGLVELQRINVAAPEILQAWSSQGAEVTFSLTDFDRQLRRWRMIYDQYQRWGRAIASADLSISNNIPVKWVAANTFPRLAPKPPRTGKRKNV